MIRAQREATDAQVRLCAHGRRRRRKPSFLAPSTRLPGGWRRAKGSAAKRRRGASLAGVHAQLWRVRLSYPTCVTWSTTKCVLRSHDHTVGISAWARWRCPCKKLRALSRRRHCVRKRGRRPPPSRLKTAIRITLSDQMLRCSLKWSAQRLRGSTHGCLSRSRPAQHMNLWCGTR